jgi:hypothetical protein
VALPARRQAGTPKHASWLDTCLRQAGGGNRNWNNVSPGAEQTTTRYGAIQETSGSMDSTAKQQMLESKLAIHNQRCKNKAEEAIPNHSLVY